MSKLQFELLALPERERMEILEEYDAHFEFGKQQGRTEEEIARELGVPEELAMELLGNGNGERYDQRYDQPQQAFTSYTQQASQPEYTQQPHYTAFNQQQTFATDSGMQGPPPGYGGAAPNGYQGNAQWQPPYEPQPYRRSVGSVLFVLIGIFFASLFVVPLLIAGWGVCISLVAVAVTLLLLPAIYVFKLVLGGPFFGGELSMVIVVFGLGIFFIQLVWWIMKMYGKMNLGYGRWIINTIRGGYR